MRGFLVCLFIWQLLWLNCKADVIIGGMKHGRSYDKTLTLRNVGNQSEALSHYSVFLYMNAYNRVIYRLNPVSTSAEVQGGSEFTICNSRISSKDGCDELWGGLNFNGNDAIELEKDGVVVDVIGWRNASGAESGGWTVSGIRDATKLHKLTRRADIRRGNLDWSESAESEWTVSSLDEEPKTEETPSPTSTDCWPFRSQLMKLPLDECSQPIPFRKRRAVIGTLNTDFLFDGEGRSFAPWQNRSAAMEHLNRIAAMIKRVSPDVMNLQEVEDRAIMEDLVDAIASPSYTVQFVQGRDSYTKQDVGLISRVPLGATPSRTDCHATYPISGSTCGYDRSGDTGVSKNLIALYDSCLFGRKFAIINVHFLAIPTTSSRCSRREAQTRVIQDVMNSLLDARFEIIMLGDINDFSDRVPDIQESTPTSHVLSMLRDPNNDGVDELQEVLGKIPQEKRYSNWYDRNKDNRIDRPAELSVLDHILLTKRLYERITRVWFDHEFDPREFSDHWPFYVEISTREFTLARKLLFKQFY